MKITAKDLQSNRAKRTERAAFRRFELLVPQQLAKKAKSKTGRILQKVTKGTKKAPLIKLNGINELIGRGPGFYLNHRDTEAQRNKDEKQALPQSFVLSKDCRNKSRFLFPLCLGVSVVNLPGSIKPGAHGVTRPTRLRRFRGSKREFVRGILFPGKRTGVRADLFSNCLFNPINSINLINAPIFQSRVSPGKGSRLDPIVRF